MVEFKTLAILIPLASALAADLPKGRIVDKVACAADPRQSYALYLPSAYDPRRPWPVLYCLDPGARGRVPVERFAEGAEKYGYIVAGSNNSKNGPLQVAIEALQAMWRDTHETLNIGEKRAYVAGMSGGARDATSFLSTGVFAGVIAQAAGFSESKVPKDFASPLFATAGTDDFNFAEMRQVDRDFEARGTPHRLVIFPGPHGWAPAPVCSEALAWFELVAMRAGTKPIDKPLIEALFKREVEAAQASEAAGEAIDARARYRSIAADFKGWQDTSPFEGKAAALGDSSEYRKAVKAEDRAASIQGTLESKLMAPAADATDSVASISALRARAASERDSEDRRIARRVLRGVTIMSWENSTVAQRTKDYPAAIASLQRASSIDPDSAELLYSLAALYALSNDGKLAVSYLNRAVKKGFHDFARLETDPDFDSVRGRADFRAFAGQGTPK